MDGASPPKFDEKFEQISNPFLRQFRYCTNSTSLSPAGTNSTSLSPTSHRGGPGSPTVHWRWDLWRTKWHWHRLLFQYLAVPCACHSTNASYSFIYHRRCIVLAKTTSLNNTLQSLSVCIISVYNSQSWRSLTLQPEMTCAMTVYFPIWPSQNLVLANLLSRNTSTDDKAALWL